MKKRVQKPPLTMLEEFLRQRRHIDALAEKHADELNAHGQRLIEVAKRAMDTEGDVVTTIRDETAIAIDRWLTDPKTRRERLEAKRCPNCGR